MTRWRKWRKSQRNPQMFHCNLWRKKLQRKQWCLQVMLFANAPLLHHSPPLPPPQTAGTWGWKSPQKVWDRFLQQQYLSWNWSWNERGCVKSDLYWWEPVPPPVSRKASQRINTLLIHLSQTLISKWIDCNKGCTCHIILAMFLLYILHIFLIRVVVAVFFFLL